jgi:hypothetical protein
MAPPNLLMIVVCSLLLLMKVISEGSYIVVRTHEFSIRGINHDIKYL